MPPHKRRRRRCKSSHLQKVSRRRLAEDGASLSGWSLVESDSSGTNSGGDGDAGAWLPLPRYQSVLASRLSRLQLPPSADGVEPRSAGSPDFPSGEILEALTCRPFLDNDGIRDALVEYQVQKCLSGTNGRDSGDSLSADHVAMDSVCSYSGRHEILEQEFIQDYEKLKSRRTAVDRSTKLNKQQLGELYLRHARFRIKALLLLKGKSIDELDDASLERKYPRELIVENSYFLKYHDHDAFGWYFDSGLCQLASLTDYQRLILVNYGGHEYVDWSHYWPYFNTPETDRDYLLYWEAMTEQIKWIEGYIHRWEKLKMKARYQAIRIATSFDNMHVELACVGFEEFIWSTCHNVLTLKDLDGVFLEIWKRVIKGQNDQACFRKALKEVYDLKMFPSRELCMKDELDNRFKMEEQFRECTVGITEQVPEFRARELIAQQIRNKLTITRGYEHYAEKKLKLAEYIGLVPKTST